jgi:ubiquinone/menaquinone biosynthesis C-methylase UbiE
VLNKYAFQSELKAIKSILPDSGKGVEIGVGSGIFAEPLGITEGVEPSQAMREKALKKNINALDGVAEDLPYSDNSFNFALMITTVCFVDDIISSFHEVYRILTETGLLIIGFVDKDSPIGQSYQQYKKESIFYRDARFYGTEELYGILRDTGFEIEGTWQTVFGNLGEIDRVQETLPGYGEGSFVVIKARKKQKM